MANTKDDADRRDRAMQFALQLAEIKVRNSGPAEAQGIDSQTLLKEAKEIDNFLRGPFFTLNLEQEAVVINTSGRVVINNASGKSSK